MKGGPGRRDDPEKGNSTGRRKREKIGRIWKVKNKKKFIQLFLRGLTSAGK